MYVGVPMTVCVPVSSLELGRRLRDAEVEDLEQARAVGALGDEEVRRLDVAVNDAERVRLGDALARLQHRDRRPPRHLRAVVAEDLVEVVALQVLHHHERHAVGQRAHVHHARDVLAAQPDGGLRLAKEPRDRRLALGHVRQQDLDRDRLLQIEVRRPDDAAHAADTDDLLDPVLAEKDVARIRLLRYRLHARRF